MGLARQPDERGGCRRRAQRQGGDRLRGGGLRHRPRDRRHVQDHGHLLPRPAEARGLPRGGPCRHGPAHPDYDMVTKVTIVPRTNGAGGFTLFTPSEERLESGMYSKRYLEGQLAVALGGRVAEEIIYGEDEVTTGASNDLQQVRSIARRMVAQWGFAMEAMGDAPVAWETGDTSAFAARAASVDTEAILDREVQKLVQGAYDRTMTTLTENKALLDYMTDRLIEAETIDYDELQAMTEAHVNGQDLKQLQSA